jgi:hypothetical protein
MAAPWWVSFLATQSRLADQVFHNDAANPEWGLLNSRAEAYPAYYALWMWNTFFPSGSERVAVKTENTDLITLAVNTPTAHNVLIANPTEKEISVRVAIRGFAVLRQARVRLLEDPQKGVVLNDLPKSPFQNLTLKPAAVAVVQFIEPPK